MGLPVVGSVNGLPSGLFAGFGVLPFGNLGFGNLGFGNLGNLNLFALAAALSALSFLNFANKEASPATPAADVVGSGNKMPNIDSPNNATSIASKALSIKPCKSFPTGSFPGSGSPCGVPTSGSPPDPCPVPVPSGFPPASPDPPPTPLPPRG